MPEVVERDPRQPSSLEKRFEGPVTEVRGVDGIAALSGEHEILIPVETTNLESLFGLVRQVTLEGFHGARGQLHASPLPRLGGRAHDVPAHILATGERPAHSDGGGVEVNVRPLERQQLPAPHAGVEGEYVERLQTIAARRLQQGPRLLRISGCISLEEGIGAFTASAGLREMRSRSHGLPEGLM